MCGMIECECSQTSHIILCLSCTVFGTNSNSSVQIQITTRFHISHNSLSVLHSVRYKFKFLGTNSNSSVQIQITTRLHISHNPLSVLHSLRRKFKFLGTNSNSSVQFQITTRFHPTVDTLPWGITYCICSEVEWLLRCVTRDVDTSHVIYDTFHCKRHTTATHTATHTYTWRRHVTRDLWHIPLQTLHHWNTHCNTHLHMT